MGAVSSVLHQGPFNSSTAVEAVTFMPCKRCAGDCAGILFERHRNRQVLKGGPMVA